MISVSRAAAARLVGAAASRGPTAARHKVRNCRAFSQGLTALGLCAAGRALRAQNPPGEIGREGR